MQVLGIVGGIASGKSLAAGIFEELGAIVLSGDHFAHQVLREADILSAIRDRWGDAIFDDAGEVDRPRVAAIVFGETAEAPKELKFLEHLTHPRIAQRLREELSRLRAEAVKIVVLDAALLLKTDWHQICEKILFLETPLPQRQKYAALRGWDAEQLARREACQLPLESKREKADFVVSNTEDLAHLREKIRSVWDSLNDSKM